MPSAMKLDVEEWDERKNKNEGLKAAFNSELEEGMIGGTATEVPGGNRERLADISHRMDQVPGLA